MDVTLPNGVLIRGVPEGTTKEQVKAKAIAAGLAAESDFSVTAKGDTKEPQSNQRAGTLTPEQFADEFGDQPDIEGLIADTPKVEQERTIKDKAIGAGEAALTAGTGATFGTLGMFAGTLKGLANEIRAGEFGTQDAADRIENMAAKVAESLTYSPKTEAGQEYVETIGEAGEALAPLGGLGAEMAMIGRSAGNVNVGTRKPTPEEVSRSTETGIPITRGEATKAEPSGFDNLKQEQFLLEQSGEAGDTMRSFKLNQSREVKKYIEGLAPKDAGDVADSVKKAIELRERSSKYKRTQAYNKLAEVTKDINVTLSTKALEDAMPDAGELRDFSATNSGQYQALTGLFEEFGVIPSKGDIPVDRLSVANQERFRKRLNKIEETDQTGSTSRIIGPIKSALDSEFELASKALEAGGSDSVALAAKNARLSHIAYKTEFDDKSLVNQLISTKSSKSKLPTIEDSQVYAKLFAKSTTQEQFDRVMGSLSRAGSKGEAARDAMKAEVILDLIDSSYSASSRKIQGERTFGANAFAKRFDQLQPKIESLFSEVQSQQLKAMRRQAEDLIPPSGAVPKGSAGFFLDSMANLGVFALLNKIPTVGPIVGNQLQEMGRSAKSASLANKAVSGYKKPKELTPLIEFNYPRLGAALGLTGVASTAINEESE